MPVKIRLARHGRKKRPYYHIVVSDSRSPRDGRYIERIGSYNPMKNPAIINLNFDRALYWLQTGAQPTHTCRSILSSKGVLLKKHLLGGVKKGVFDDKTAEEKFKNWISEKEKKIQHTKESLVKTGKELQQQRLQEESEVNIKRAQVLAARKAKSTKESTPEISKDEILEEKDKVTEKTAKEKIEDKKEKEKKDTAKIDVSSKDKTTS